MTNRLFKKCRKILHLSMLSILNFSMLLSSPVYADSFFSGSCTSQGDWVSTALTQAESILNAMEVLRTDPNCTGIEGVIQNFAPTASIASGKSHSFDPVTDLRKVSREIKDLRLMSQRGNESFRGRVMDVLMGRMSDEAQAKAGLEGFSEEALKNTVGSNNRVAERAANTLDTFASGVGEAFKGSSKASIMF